VKEFLVSCGEYNEEAALHKKGCEWTNRKIPFPDHDLIFSDVKNMILNFSNKLLNAGIRWNRESIPSNWLLGLIH